MLHTKQGQSRVQCGLLGISLLFVWPSLRAGLAALVSLSVTVVSMFSFNLPVGSA